MIKYEMLTLTYIAVAANSVNFSRYGVSLVFPSHCTNNNGLTSNVIGWRLYAIYTK